MLEVGNTTSTVLTANQTVPFTTVLTNTTPTKTSFDSNSNSLLIKRTGNSGYYNAGGSFVFTPTMAGVVSIQMYVNGNAEPTAISTFSASAGDSYTFTIPSKYIKTVVASYGTTVPISFVVTADGTLENANAFVYYIPSVNE